MADVNTEPKINATTKQVADNWWALVDAKDPAAKAAYDAIFTDPNAKLNDRQLIEQLHAKFPDMVGNFNITDWTAQPPAAATPAGPSLWEGAVVNPAKELYSGYLEGTGKFANTLANIPMLVGAHGTEKWLRGQSAAFEQKAKDVAPKTESFTSPIYKGFGSAIPTMATYAPAMPAGPAAPLVMGGIGALEGADKGWEAAVQGGLGAALTGKYLHIVNQVPGLKKLVLAGAPNVAIDLVKGIESGLPADEILKNMTASGVTMAGLVGFTPESAKTAIDEAARLVRSASGAWQEAVAPTRATTLRTSPPPKPIDISKPIDITSTAATAAAKPAPAAAPALSAPAQAALDIILRNVARNPKFKANSKMIAEWVGTKNAGKVYGELIGKDFLNGDGTLNLPSTGASKPAAAPTAPRPAGLTTPPPGSSPEALRTWAAASARDELGIPSFIGPEPRPAGASVRTAPPPVRAAAPAPTPTPAPFVGPKPPAAAATPAPKGGVPQPTPEEVAAAQAAFAAPAPEPPPITPEQQIAQNQARIAELERLQAAAQASADAQPTPMVSRPTAESPKSSAKPVEPAPAAPAPAAPAPAPAPVESTPAPQPPVETPPAPAPAAAGAARNGHAADVDLIKQWAAGFVKGEQGTQYYDWKRPAEPGEVPAGEVWEAFKRVGHDMLADAGRNFEQWRSAMVDKLGNVVEAYLMPIWQQVTAAGAARPAGALAPPESAAPAEPALPPAPPPKLRVGDKEIPVTITRTTPDGRLITEANPEILNLIQAPQAPPAAPPRAGLPPAYIGPDTSPLPGESRADVGRISTAIAAQGGPAAPRVLQMPVNYGEPVMTKPEGAPRRKPGAPKPKASPVQSYILPEGPRIERGIGTPEERTKALMEDNRPGRPPLPDEQVSAMIEQGKSAGRTRANEQRAAEQEQARILSQRAGAVVQATAPPPGPLPAPKAIAAEPGERSYTTDLDRKAMQDQAVAAGRAPLEQIPEKPLPTGYIYPLEVSLRATGFQERNLAMRFQGTERPHVGGRTNAPRKPVTATLPSGNQSDAVWTKPVKGGLIEIQWDRGTHEFQATKYDLRHGAPDYTVRGVGPNEMVDFLNHVRQAEQPVPAGQKAGRTTTAKYTPATLAERVATAAPPSPREQMDEAAFNIMKRTTGAPPEDLPRIIANAIGRAAGEEVPQKVEPGREPIEIPSLPKGERLTMAEQLRGLTPQSSTGWGRSEEAQDALKGALKEDRGPTGFRRGSGSKLYTPEDWWVDPMEKNARDLAVFTGGAKFVPEIRDQMASIIANAVLAKRAELGLPAPQIRPQKDIEVATRNKRAPLPESSFEVKPMVEVAGMPEGPDTTWMVRPKGGDGNTNVHINKVKNNRFEIRIGNQLMRATSSLTAAKVEALKLAEAQLYKAAEQNTPFHVEGIGTYSPLQKFTAPGGEDRMFYQFIPQWADAPVKRSMPLKYWEGLKVRGTPVNPIAPPEGKVGRPPKTEAPPVRLTMDLSGDVVAPTPAPPAAAPESAPVLRTPPPPTEGTPRIRPPA